MEDTRSKLGELLVLGGTITRGQLNDALHMQKKQIRPQRLGDILIEKGYVTGQKLRKAVEESGKRELFGEMLVHQGFITREQLERALAEQNAKGGHVGSILVSHKVLDEEKLARALAHQLDIPYVVPQPNSVELRTFNRLAEGFVREYLVVPICGTGGTPTFLVADPMQPGIRNRLEEKLHCPVELAVANRSSIESLIDNLLRQRRVGTTAVVDESLAPVAAEDPHQLVIRGQEMKTRGPGGAAHVFDYIVWDGWNQRASDIHIEPQQGCLQVRYRVDGTLMRQAEFPSALAVSIFKRAEVLASLDTDSMAIYREGLIRSVVDGERVDLRLALARSVLGKNMVIRLFPQRMSRMDLKELGMPPRMAATFQETLEKGASVALFVGAKATGKTSSLYSVLGQLNDGTRKIITLECPVAFALDGVTQCSMTASDRPAIPDILTSLLQHDPDVMALDEIADLPSAEAVLKCTMMGHRCLATMHADDGAAALVYLAQTETLTALLRSCAIAVVSQRLVRQVCSNCAEEYTPPMEVLREFQAVDVEASLTHFRRGAGCTRCKGTGVAGRTGIFELLVVRQEIREALTRKGTVREIRQLARKDPGFLSLRQTGFIKACQGRTTLEEVQLVAPSSEADPPEGQREPLSELLRKAGENIGAR
jgi:type II secretory ATPase GspE/PulE/Tfp pilus assembly ATPase PilB-like protein